MIVYRIVKSKARTNDLSGTGAFRAGGRWNSRGVYMLYTSANSSLALLENLVYFELAEAPPGLFLMQIEISDSSLVFMLPDAQYPQNWLQSDLQANKRIGDDFTQKQKYLALGVRSAVNSLEYNFLLNPLFPAFRRLVKVVQITEIFFDQRLL